MLTDRQLVALALLSNTVSNESDLIYLARSKGSKKIVNYALKCADMFLEETKNVDNTN